MPLPEMRCGVSIFESGVSIILEKMPLDKITLEKIALEKAPGNKCHPEEMALCKFGKQWHLISFFCIIAKKT